MPQFEPLIKHPDQFRQKGFVPQFCYEGYGELLTETIDNPPEEPLSISLYPLDWHGRTRYWSPHDKLRPKRTDDGPHHLEVRCEVGESKTNRGMLVETSRYINEINSNGRHRRWFPGGLLLVHFDVTTLFLMVNAEASEPGVLLSSPGAMGAVLAAAGVLFASPALLERMLTPQPTPTSKQWYKAFHATRNYGNIVTYKATE